MPPIFQLVLFKNGIIELHTTIELILVMKEISSIGIRQTKTKTLREVLQVCFSTHAFLPLYISSMPQELSFDMYIDEVWAL